MTALLFARDLRIARAWAVVDRGWKEVSPIGGDFETALGERVRYVPDTPGSIYGFPTGTFVYLAHSWEQRRDSETINAFIVSGRFDVANGD